MSSRPVTSQPPPLNTQNSLTPMNPPQPLLLPAGSFLSSIEAARAIPPGRPQLIAHLKMRDQEPFQISLEQFQIIDSSRLRYDDFILEYFSRYSVRLTPEYFKALIDHSCASGSPRYLRSTLPLAIEAQPWTSILSTLLNDWKEAMEASRFYSTQLKNAQLTSLSRAIECVPSGALLLCRNLLSIWHNAHTAYRRRLTNAAHRVNRSIKLVRLQVNLEQFHYVLRTWHSHTFRCPAELDNWNWAGAWQEAYPFHSILRKRQIKDINGKLSTEFKVRLRFGLSTYVPYSILNRIEGAAVKRFEKALRKNAPLPYDSSSDYENEAEEEINNAIQDNIDIIRDNSTSPARFTQVTGAHMRAARLHAQFLPPQDPRLNTGSLLDSEKRNAALPTNPSPGSVPLNEVQRLIDQAVAAAISKSPSPVPAPVASIVECVNCFNMTSASNASCEKCEMPHSVILSVADRYALRDAKRIARASANANTLSNNSDVPRTFNIQSQHISPQHSIHMASRSFGIPSGSNHSGCTAAQLGRTAVNAQPLQNHYQPGSDHRCVPMVQSLPSRITSSIPHEPTPASSSLLPRQHLNLAKCRKCGAGALSITDELCHACFTPIAPQGVKCDSCFKPIDDVLDVVTGLIKMCAIDVKRCRRCGQTQRRHMVDEQARILSYEKTTKAAPTNVISTSTQSKGVATTLVITPTQDRLFQSIRAGSVQPVLFQECCNADEWLKCIIDCCSGTPGAYILNHQPMPIVPSGRIFICMAKGFNYGAVKQIKGKVKDKIALTCYSQEFKAQADDGIEFDTVKFSAAAINAEIDGYDFTDPNIWNIMVADYSRVAWCIRTCLSDVFSREYESVYQGIGRRHNEEPIPRITYTPENCDNMINGIVQQWRASNTSFLDGALYFDNQYGEDSIILHEGSHAARLELWFEKFDPTTNTFKCSAWFTRTFLDPDDRKSKRQIRELVTTLQEQSSELARLKASVTGLSKKPSNPTPVTTPTTTTTSPATTTTSPKKKDSKSKPTTANPPTSTTAAPGDPHTYVPVLPPKGKDANGNPIEGAQWNVVLTYNRYRLENGLTLKWPQPPDFRTEWKEILGSDLVCVKCNSNKPKFHNYLNCCNPQSQHAFIHKKTGELGWDLRAVSKWVQELGAAGCHWSAEESADRYHTLVHDIGTGVTPWPDTSSTQAVSPRSLSDRVWAGGTDIDEDQYDMPSTKQLAARFTFGELVKDSFTEQLSAPVSITFELSDSKFVFDTTALDFGHFCEGIIGTESHRCNFLSLSGVMEICASSLLQKTQSQAHHLITHSKRNSLLELSVGNVLLDTRATRSVENVATPSQAGTLDWLQFLFPTELNQRAVLRVRLFENYVDADCYFLATSSINLDLPIIMLIAYEGHMYGSPSTKYSLRDLCDNKCSLHQGLDIRLIPCATFTDTMAGVTPTKSHGMTWLNHMLNPCCDQFAPGDRPKNSSANAPDPKETGMIHYASTHNQAEERQLNNTTACISTQQSPRSARHWSDFIETPGAQSPTEDSSDETCSLPSDHSKHNRRIQRRFNPGNIQDSTPPTEQQVTASTHQADTKNLHNRYPRRSRPPTTTYTYEFSADINQVLCKSILKLPSPDRILELHGAFSSSDSQASIDLASQSESDTEQHEQPADQPTITSFFIHQSGVTSMAVPSGDDSGETLRQLNEPCPWIDDCDEVSDGSSSDMDLPTDLANGDLLQINATAFGSAVMQTQCTNQSTLVPKADRVCFTDRQLPISKADSACFTSGIAAQSSHAVLQADLCQGLSLLPCTCNAHCKQSCLPGFMSSHHRGCLLLSITNQPSEQLIPSPLQQRLLDFNHPPDDKNVWCSNPSELAPLLDYAVHHLPVPMRLTAQHLAAAPVNVLCTLACQQLDPSTLQRSHPLIELVTLAQSDESTIAASGNDILLADLVDNVSTITASQIRINYNSVCSFQVLQLRLVHSTWNQALFRTQCKQCPALVTQAANFTIWPTDLRSKIVHQIIHDLTIAAIRNSISTANNMWQNEKVGDLILAADAAGYLPDAPRGPWSFFSLSAWLTRPDGPIKKRGDLSLQQLCNHCLCTLDHQKCIEAVHAISKLANSNMNKNLKRAHQSFQTILLSHSTMSELTEPPRTCTSANCNSDQLSLFPMCMACLIKSELTDFNYQRPHLLLQHTLPLPLNFETGVTPSCKQSKADDLPIMQIQPEASHLPLSLTDALAIDAIAYETFLEASSLFLQIPSDQCLATLPDAGICFLIHGDEETCNILRKAKLNFKSQRRNVINLVRGEFLTEITNRLADLTLRVPAVCKAWQHAYKKFLKPQTLCDHLVCIMKVGTNRILSILDRWEIESNILLKSLVFTWQSASAGWRASITETGVTPIPWQHDPSNCFSVLDQDESSNLELMHPTYPRQAIISFLDSPAFSDMRRMLLSRDILWRTIMDQFHIDDDSQGSDPAWRMKYQAALCDFRVACIAYASDPEDIARPIRFIGTMFRSHHQGRANLDSSPSRVALHLQPLVATNQLSQQHVDFLVQAHAFGLAIEEMRPLTGAAIIMPNSKTAAPRAFVVQDFNFAQAARGRVLYFGNSCTEWLDQQPELVASPVAVVDKDGAAGRCVNNLSAAPKDPSCPMETSINDGPAYPDLTELRGSTTLPNHAYLIMQRIVYILLFPFDFPAETWLENMRTALVDLKSAYYRLGCHADAIGMQCIRLMNQWIVALCMVFGARRSGEVYPLITTAILELHHSMQPRNTELSGSANFCSSGHTDDFSIIEVNAGSRLREAFCAMIFAAKVNAGPDAPAQKKLKKNGFFSGVHKFIGAIDDILELTFNWPRAKQIETAKLINSKQFDASDPSYPALSTMKVVGNIRWCGGGIVLPLAGLQRMVGQFGVKATDNYRVRAIPMPGESQEDADSKIAQDIHILRSGLSMIVDHPHLAKVSMLSCLSWEHRMRLPGQCFNISLLFGDASFWGFAWGIEYMINGTLKRFAMQLEHSPEFRAMLVNCADGMNNAWTVDNPPACINCAELAWIAMAEEEFAETLTCCLTISMPDNKNCTYWLNKGYAKQPMAQALILRMTKCRWLRENPHLSVHLPRDNNILFDNLSKNANDEFDKLNQLLDVPFVLLPTTERSHRIQAFMPNALQANQPCAVEFDNCLTKPVIKTQPAAHHIHKEAVRSTLPDWRHRINAAALIHADPLYIFNSDMVAAAYRNQQMVNTATGSLNSNLNFQSLQLANRDGDRSKFTWTDGFHGGGGSSISIISAGMHVIQGWDNRPSAVNLWQRLTGISSLGDVDCINFNRLQQTNAATFSTMCAPHSSAMEHCKGGLRGLDHPGGFKFTKMFTMAAACGAQFVVFEQVADTLFSDAFKLMQEDAAQNGFVEPMVEVVPMSLFRAEDNCIRLMGVSHKEEISLPTPFTFPVRLSPMPRDRRSVAEIMLCSTLVPRRYWCFKPITHVPCTFTAGRINVVGRVGDNQLEDQVQHPLGLVGKQLSSGNTRLVKALLLQANCVRYSAFRLWSRQPIHAGKVICRWLTPQEDMAIYDWPDGTPRGSDRDCYSMTNAGVNITYFTRLMEQVRLKMEEVGIAPGSPPNPGSYTSKLHPDHPDNQKMAASTVTFDTSIFKANQFGSYHQPAKIPYSRPHNSSTKLAFSKSIQRHLDMDHSKLRYPRRRSLRRSRKVFHQTQLSSISETNPQPPPVARHQLRAAKLVASISPPPPGRVCIQPHLQQDRRPYVSPALIYSTQLAPAEPIDSLDTGILKSPHNQNKRPKTLVSPSNATRDRTLEQHRALSQSCYHSYEHSAVVLPTASEVERPVYTQASYPKDRHALTNKPYSMYELNKMEEVRLSLLTGYLKSQRDVDSICKQWESHCSRTDTCPILDPLDSPRTTAKFRQASRDWALIELGPRGIRGDSCGRKFWAVAKMHESLELPNPFADDHRLSLLLSRARKKDPAPIGKLPATLALTDVLDSTLDLSTIEGFTVSAYHLNGMAYANRVSEIAIDEQHTIRWCDISFARDGEPLDILASELHPDAVTETQQSDKTTRFGQGLPRRHFINPSDSWHCIVTRLCALKRRLATVGMGKDTDPVFSWSPGAGVTRRMSQKLLKRAAVLCGIPGGDVGTHSLRAGSMSAALAAGIPWHEAKDFLRWRSDKSAALYAWPHTQVMKGRAAAFFKSASLHTATRINGMGGYPQKR